MKKLVENIDKEGDMENQLYSPEFSAYLLNNYTGLASFWTSIHVNNQLKHGTVEAYLEWSIEFGGRLSVKNPAGSAPEVF